VKRARNNTVTTTGSSTTARTLAATGTGTGTRTSQTTGWEKKAINSRLYSERQHRQMHATSSKERTKYRSQLGFTAGHTTQILHCGRDQRRQQCDNAEVGARIQGNSVSAADHIYQASCGNPPHPGALRRGASGRARGKSSAEGTHEKRENYANVAIQPTRAGMAKQVHRHRENQRTQRASKAS